MRERRGCLNVPVVWCEQTLPPTTCLHLSERAPLLESVCGQLLSLFPPLSLATLSRPVAERPGDTTLGRVGPGK